MLPARLTYDVLPPGGTITWREEGESIVITAPGGAVGDTARRVARDRAILTAGWVCGGVLLVLVGLGGQTAYQHRREIPWWTFPLFALFCLAIFALLAQIFYTKKLDVLHRAARQSTMLAIRAQRLLIETKGPYGDESHDLTRTQIREVQWLAGDRQTRLGEEMPMEWLVIFLQDGREIRLLPGCSEAELKWVSGTIRRVMGLGAR